jgi:chromosome segregation ATPase
VCSLQLKEDLSKSQQAVDTQIAAVSSLQSELHATHAEARRLQESYQDEMQLRKSLEARLQSQTKELEAAASWQVKHSALAASSSAEIERLRYEIAKAQEETNRVSQQLDTESSGRRALETKIQELVPRARFEQLQVH